MAVKKAAPRTTKEQVDTGKRSYYRVGSYEVIDIIEAYDLNFNVGNVVKYALRAGRKDPTTVIEELTKASWYIARELERVKKVSK